MKNTEPQPAEQARNDNGGSRCVQCWVLRIRYLITLPCYFVMAALTVTEPTWKMLAIIATLMVTDILSFTGSLIDND